MIQRDRRSALLALSALWLSACGGGGSSDGEASAVSSQSTSSSPSPGPTTSPSPPAASPPAASPPAASPPAASPPAASPPAASPPAATSTTAHYADFSGAALGIGAALNGAIAFPADNAWNTDISAAAVDPNSDALIASIGTGVGLHADFGAGLYNGAPIGIPYVVVGGTQAQVAMNWTAYGSESDPGPYPVPSNAPIEGAVNAASADDGGDRHVLVIDRDHNRLYEFGRAFLNSNGSWNADSGAVFDLDSDNVRPTAQPGWTSADAAGLPIFPGLARYEEAVLGPGGIRHALRFTVQHSRHAYLPPANHYAASSTSTSLPPMGMRVRLKASYAIPASFSAETRALLTAMKTYGMIVADNGSNWFVSGTPDDRWDNDALSSELSQVHGSNFEVVLMQGLVTN